VALRTKGGTGLLPILAGVATAEAIMDVTGIKAELKWPNDVLVRGRKVGGVLAESGWLGDEMRSALLGIGVNVNNPIPEEIPEATSFASEVGKEIDLEYLLESLIGRLDHHLALMDASPQMIIQSWKALNQTLGNIVEVSNEPDVVTRGLAVDIDSDGALILKTDDGLKRVVSGHVIIVLDKINYTGQ
jgi:BirA family biotin operon repressor/biotin-[acetyl-CoA-carboxylase] ligase